MYIQAITGKNKKMKIYDFAVVRVCLVMFLDRSAIVNAVIIFIAKKL